MDAKTKAVINVLLDALVEEKGTNDPGILVDPALILFLSPINWN